MRIVIISGSPRSNSVTHRAALHLFSRLKETEHQVDMIDLKTIAFPQLQSVFTSVETTPEPYKAVSELMLGADAFVVLTPEYNGSYSASLKNLLDHYPKQHHKVFSIATATTGALGGVRAALQLQELIYALFGIGSPYMLVIPHVDKKFDAEGRLLDEGFQKSIDTFLREFLWLAEKLSRD
ncbi:MAG TPA: NAD(P)H-dependent oxidoreductase [Flavisolibacter sp.]|nr:NAD(P)H-dependent oxidoreductase [Flavisolibacter sp.]